MPELYCHAEINYLTEDGLSPVEVPIFDGRRADTTLNSEGFELIQLPSAVKNWADMHEIDTLHYPEVVHFAQTLTGCDAVLFFPAITRSPETARHSADYAPILSAHSDYTENYFDMIRDASSPYHKILLPSLHRAGISSTDVASACRALTLQLWRNVGAAEVQFPLGVGDCRTFPREQLQPLRVATYGEVETQFDAFGVLHTPAAANNHWYTFPRMQASEVLLFRAYDSQCVENGQPFWTPHTASKDPQGSQPRMSIEMRAICLFW